MSAVVKRKAVKPNKLVIAVIAVIVIAMITSVCLITADNGKTKPPAQMYSFNKEIASGIDVSEHNGKVDWKKVKSEFDFAFIRVGYRGYAKGNLCEDKYAKSNMKSANKAGVPIGVYFYTQAITTAEAEKEADYLLDIIKHYEISLPVIIDFEYAADSNGNLAGRLKEANLTPQQSADIINAFCAKVSDKGYTYGVYASSSVFRTSIASKALDKQALIWVADYNSKVSYNVKYNVWQYSKTGKSDAVSSKYVDLNYWYEN